jgi:hypothetical protein
MKLYRNRVSFPGANSSEKRMVVIAFAFGDHALKT